MDEDIPPENEKEPFADDSENAPEDEFPEKGNSEEMLDEDFKVSEIPSSNRDDNEMSNRPMKNDAVGHDERRGYEARGDNARMGDEDLSFDKTPLKPDHAPIEEVSLDQVDVSKVPIRIDLELTRVKVSLRELQKMEPGQKLPIDINPRIVNLVIGGKTIGRGEVVDIGDSSCVKILELYK